MCRYEDQPAALEVGFSNASIVQDRGVRFAQELKRVDYRVSCDRAPLGRQALFDGLWYPIAIAGMTLVVGVLFLPETKDVDIRAA